MIGRWSIHGHAIVSADDRIADRSGVTPPALHNEADWVRFQEALDAAAVTVLGRLGHEANPNRKQRKRLVLSSSALGIERRPDAWWWNPAEVAVEEALALAAPGGGIAAVPGGRRVFDLFLDVGFDAFHLARANNVRIPDGAPIFSRIFEGRTAAEILSDNGLLPEAEILLDPEAGVSLTTWRGA